MAHRGRSHKLKERFAYGQARARRGRGVTMKPSQAVGPRSPLQPKGLAAKSAHIVGSATVSPGQKVTIALVPKEYPYFTAHAANVVANGNVSMTAKVGGASVQKLKVGYQKLSNWPPGSTTGLAREVHVVVQNHGKTTVKVKIDLSVMPMEHL